MRSNLSPQERVLLEAFLCGDRRLDELPDELQDLAFEALAEDSMPASALTGSSPSACYARERSL